MPRIFLGIDVPDAVDLDLQLMIGGVQGARWQTPDQVHLTLNYLGEIDGGQTRRLLTALERLDAPSFEMQLRGAGVFPPRGPARVLWLGVRDADPIHLVHDRCAKIIDALRLPRDRRKFAPHVTLARLERSPNTEVAAWVLGHAGYESASWSVGRIHVYSSILARGGAKYCVEGTVTLG